MSNSDPGGAIAPVGPLALLAAGREAFRVVPQLRGLLIKGFLLLYGLFALLGAGLLGLVYRFAVQPLSQGMAAYRADGGFFMDLLYPLLSGLVWLGQALLLAATLLLAFMLSLSLLSVWFEALAGRVAAHARGRPVDQIPFSLGLLLAGVGRSLKDSGVMLALAVLALAAGFIPLAGPFLAFALGSYMMGWEIREPYLAVRAAEGERYPALRKGLTWWTLRVGALPVLLAMVPWVGWMLLPFALVYMVAGVAWRSAGGTA